MHRKDAVNSPNDWTCNYCDKILKCLIAPARPKENLSGGSKNCVACPSVPERVFEEISLQRREKEDRKKSLQAAEDAKAHLKKRAQEAEADRSQSKKLTCILEVEKKMRTDLEEQWGRFVFQAAIPFRIDEHPELDDFLIMYERYILAGLRNSGTPDRRNIGDKLLDNQYARLEPQVLKQCLERDDYKPMGTDGWSNVRS